MNSIEMDISNNNELPQVIAICSGAGGVGKSCSTAYLSVAIAEMTGEKVLCANLNKEDHASLILGVPREYKFDIRHTLCEVIDEIKNTEESSYEIFNPLVSACTNTKGVDVLTYSKIEYIRMKEQLTTGMCNLKQIFDYASTLNKYKYIVCDSGRGLYNDFEKQSIYLADMVIIPFNNSIHALRGAETIYKQIEAMCANSKVTKYKTKRVYFFYNKGDKKLQKKYQKRCDDILTNLIKAFKENLNINASVIKAVIPETTRIENCIRNEKNLFVGKKVKDIADAYLLAASEIELSIKKQIISELTFSR